MLRITRDRIVYALDKTHPTVATVEPGAEVLFETWDARTGTIRSERDLLDRPHPRGPNPATGPICIRGAEPGDVLMVDILDIGLADQGYTGTRPGQGVLGSLITQHRTKLLDIVDGMIVFNDRIRFPVRPMVGVIGTAPAGDGVATLHPGPHGGNMDHNDVRVGARVHLPVFVPGALLAVGDVHASMGDGELSGGGFDVPAEVTMRVGLRKGLRLRWPRIERDGCVVTTSAHGDPLEAMRIAVEEMVGLLGEHLRLGRADALMLLSVRGDVQVCTCHNHPQAGHTMRVTFPKMWKE